MSTELKLLARRLVKRVAGKEATLSDAPLWVIRKFVGDSTKIETKYGFPILLDLHDSYIGSSLLRRRVHEPETSAFVRRLVVRDCVCLDIGANIGYYTLLLGHAVGRTGRVYAFEPNPSTAEYLRRNVALNFSDQRVTTIQAAVADTAGEATLYGLSNHSGNTSIVNFSSVGALRAPLGTTSTVAIDDVLGDAAIDFAKIDVEGAEASVIRGMHASLRRSGDAVVVCEIAPRWLEAAGSSAAEIGSLFADVGMEPYLIHADGSCAPADLLELDDRLRKLEANDNVAFMRPSTYAALAESGRIARSVLVASR